jgi:hypothetical protein
MKLGQELPKPASDRKAQIESLVGRATGNCASVLLSSDGGRSFAPQGCVDNRYLIENTLASVTRSGRDELLMLYVA